MATAKKLPSGKYRCLAFVGTDADGKKIRKSFTADTKKEAEYLAAEYLIKNKYIAQNGIIFKDALQSYINKREGILAPSTIREYTRAAKNDFNSIDNIPVDQLTQDDIQDMITKLSKDHSPKTVRNAHGLISAVLKDIRPDFKLNTALPAKVKPDIYIPSDNEVKKAVEYVRSSNDHDMLIAILLAAYAPMRRSEIAALTMDDIDGNVIHVHKAMVLDKNKQWIIKTPKTIAGDRYISMPDFVINELKGKTGKVVDLNPSMITDRFTDVLKRAKIHHFKFHALRHYSASIQHAMGIPDAYIMQRGGWENDGVLKEIYRHALDAEAKKANDKINEYFTKINK